MNNLMGIGPQQNHGAVARRNASAQPPAAAELNYFVFLAGGIIAIGASSKVVTGINDTALKGICAGLLFLSVVRLVQKGMDFNALKNDAIEIISRLKNGAPFIIIMLLAKFAFSYLPHNKS